MARLTKFVLVLVSVLSVSLAAPATSHAGIIPWAYDAVFGPVGSMRYGTGYAPTTVAYGNRGYSPYSVGYAPVSAAYTPMVVAYGPSGDSCGCSQSTYYPGTSYYGGSQVYYGAPMSGCSSGNCSNCTTGSNPVTTKYPSPTPDYNHSNPSYSDVLERLRRLEQDYEHHGQFLQKKYDDYQPPKYNRPTSGGERVLPRSGVGSGTRNETFSSDENYQPPTRSKRSRELEPIDSIETKKPELGTPTDNETKGPTPKPDELPKTESTQPAKEADVHSQRSLNGLTAGAVAPRLRTRTSIDSTSKVSVAKSSKKPTKMVLDSSLSGDIARH